MRTLTFLAAACLSVGLALATAAAADEPKQPAPPAAAAKPAPATKPTAVLPPAPAKSPVAATPAPAAAHPAGPDYRRDVEPLLKQYCLGCHGADEPESDLNLEDFAALLKGGKGGVVVVPGRSELSRLTLTVEGKAEPVMPPEGNEAPSPEELAVLKAWIDAGAKGPSGAAPDPTILVTPQVPPRRAVRSPVTAAAYSPDGAHVAVARYGQVEIVSVESRAVVRRLAGLRGRVTDVEYSADGKTLLTAAGEPGVFGEAQLWNAADGKLLRTFTGHKDSLYAAALSPDGRLVATASYDQQIKLWDAATGKELRTLAGHNGAVFDVAFRPDGKVLASASADRTIKLWDVASGQRLDTFAQPLKEQYTVAFRADGRQLAAGGMDNRIRVWNITPAAKEGTNQLVLARFAHEGAILRLAYSRDGQTLVSTGEDRAVRLWNVKGYTERKPVEAQTDWGTALALAPDGKTVLVGRLDGAYAWYDAMTGEPRLPAKPELLAVMPRGIQRGEATRVVLKGKHLAAATQVTVAPPAGAKGKVAVRWLPDDPQRPDERIVELTAEASLPRGTYQVTVSSAGGTSAAKPIQIDDLPQREETEPNDMLSRAATAELPAGVWGTLARPGDIDHIRFAGRRGQTIVCQLDGRRIGSTINAVLTLLDPEGNVVASNNEFDGQPDPLVAYTLPRDGVYGVRVTDLAMSGSAEHWYRVSIGELPLVTGVMPLAVQVGQPTELVLAGFNLPAEARVSVTAAKPGSLPVPLDAAKYRTTRPLAVLATTEPEVVEREPNDGPAQATPLPVPGHGHGRIHSTAAAGLDQDLFRFEATAGTSYIVEVEAQRRNSPLDSRIEVLDAAGRPVERLLLVATRDSYITFRGIDSTILDCRVKNWEEMELNEYMYLQGEVCKLFRLPQGPDSGFAFYGSAGKRRCYFDTSPTGHALDEPCYIVEPHPPGTKLIPSGLPVFPLYYANDDDGLRKLKTDSRLTFTAPRDGSYLVRVGDSRGFQGDRFAYRLTVRPAAPDFQVRVATMNPTVNADSARGIRFEAERIDGFDGDIRLDVAGLPAGYTLPNPLVIEAGHDDCMGALTAAADAKSATAEDWAKVRITARAQVGEETVERSVAPWGAVTLGPVPKVRVRIEPAEVEIEPGQTVKVLLRVERDDFTDRIQFDALNLPHGVYVDNIGLNGILIPEGQTEREFFLTARNWVQPTDRPYFFQTKAVRGGAANAGDQASPAVMLRVRPAQTVAQSNEPAPPAPSTAPK